MLPGLATVLVVEDDAGTARLECRTLERAGLRVEIAGTVAAACGRLARSAPFSAVLLDFRLPDGEAWPVVDAARACSPPVPVVMVTAMGNEETAAQALERGSAAYIIKSTDFLNRLPSTIEQVITRFEAERTRSRLAAIVEGSSDAIIGCSPDGIIDSWNQAAAALLGWPEHEAIGRHVSIVIRPKPDLDLLMQWDSLGKGARLTDVQLEVHARDGRAIPVSLSAAPVWSGGVVTGYAAMLRDTSERLGLEEQLRQSHKMEAIGQLAGGIAHDFNNVLTIILNAASLASQAGPDEVATYLRTILDAGSRASRLTRQLLMFARNQPVQVQQIDVNAAVRGMSELLSRVLGPTIQIDIVPSEVALCITMDQTQFEQILLNLAVNAHDAMPHGGTFALVVEHRPPGPSSPDLAVIRVTDTGVGMSPDVQARIFEPFYTTKAHGGTGLGLAVVYGIVSQAGGSIAVTSTVGRGTQLEISLPATRLTPHQLQAQGSAAAVPRSRVLLVDDEESLRRVLRKVLQGAGHHVVVAESGNDALRQVAEGAGPFDVLVTDVIMPGMQGPRLAEELRQRWPDLPVIFTSGFTDDAFQDGVHGARFLAKPFAAADLLKAIGEILAAAPH